MKIKNVLAASAVAIFGGASIASAATCSIGNASFTLNPAVGSAECYSGNDTNTIDDAFEMFSMTGWVLADKNDDMNSGDQSIMFDGSVADNVANGTKGGDWAITSLAASKVVVTLKAGNQFGAFLVDSLTGTWSATKDLSHSSIYYIPGGGVGGQVPLPAAGWMLIAGLGGIAAVRRRKP